MKLIASYTFTYIERHQNIGENMAWILRKAYAEGAEIKITFLREGLFRVDLLKPEHDKD